MASIVRFCHEQTFKQKRSETIWIAKTILAIISLTFFTYEVKGACTSRYPFGLKGASLEVNYVNMATFSDGNMILAGYSN